MIIMTDVLETIIGSSPGTKTHAPLLTAIAQKTRLEGIAFVAKRDHFVPTPHRILDKDGKFVSHHFKEWMRDKLDQQRGDHYAVWQRYKDAGYLLTERIPVSLYLIHDGAAIRRTSCN